MELTKEEEKLILFERERKQRNLPTKRGFLKHDLFRLSQGIFLTVFSKFQDLNPYDDEVFLSEEGVEEFIQKFNLVVREKYAQKGEEFLYFKDSLFYPCWQENGRAGGTFSESWGEENLENIQDI